MPVKGQEISHRNRSPYGWWIGSYVEQAVWDDDPNPSPDSSCLAWENTIIFEAPDREAAYTKMLSLCKDRTSFTSEDGNRQGRWVFLGISNLLPIYEEIEDGAEILWKEYKDKTVGDVRSLVLRKEDLIVFKE